MRSSTKSINIALAFAASLFFVVLASGQNTFPESGNVGVGTLSPAASLDIAGDLRVLNGNLKFDYSWLPNPVFDGVTYTTRATLYTPEQGSCSSISIHTGAYQTALVADGPIISTESGACFAGKVGIGTNAPAGKLHINQGSIVQTSIGGASDPWAKWMQLGDWSYTNYPLYLSQSYYGLGITWDSDAMFVGLADTGSNRKDAVIAWGDDDNDPLRFLFNSGELMRLTPAGRLGIGTATPTEMLSVNGKIRAQEVIVETTGWSDHVLGDDYNLQPLAQVEQHIKQERHLPGVPSAKDVAENGVSLGEMQAILLAKIEELTLHVIRLEKENSALQRRVLSLEGSE